MGQDPRHIGEDLKQSVTGLAESEPLIAATEGLGKLGGMVQDAASSLISGSTPRIIAENIRSLMNRGLSEASAIAASLKHAQATDIELPKDLKGPKAKVKRATSQGR